MTCKVLSFGIASSYSREVQIRQLRFLAIHNLGVTRHVGEALGEEVHVRGSNIVALGIAPWGVVQQRELLIGLNPDLYHMNRDPSISFRTFLKPELFPVVTFLIERTPPHEFSMPSS
ncbi:unnamed protein product [Dibothriocephalus latus]|uniref:TRPM SLOG domain-containing protein n=1 Tax=Dibothriocephalus latus TaxID=60516 RepID=A0A3P7MIA5_DIBLA|nr:unnamed protein product [Dibothriocephalus latus]